MNLFARMAWLLSGLTLLLPPSTARATVIVDAPLETYVEKASVIVRGTILSQQVLSSPNSRDVATVTELRVRESIKGGAQGSILLRQPGGVVGDREQRVAGVPRFYEGEDVLVFLEPAPDDPSLYVVLGLSSGKFRMEKSATGELRATRQMDGLSAYQAPTPNQQAKLKVLTRDDAGNAEELLNRVRKLAAKRNQ